MTPNERRTIKTCIAILTLDGHNTKKAVKEMLTELLEEDDDRTPQSP